MAFIAPALPFLAAASAVASAAGTFIAGSQQAAVSRYNAQVEQQRATEAQETADAAATQQEITNAQQRGQVASEYAAANLDLTGSPLDVMYSTTRQGELQAQMIRWQGKTQSAADTQQGLIDTANASSAATAGATEAGQTLLTGAQTFLGPKGLNVGAGTSPASQAQLTAYRPGVN